ncbi:MAG: hypothetical protein AAGG11_13910 [Pseudomonadota bacterium]
MQRIFIILLVLLGLSYGYLRFVGFDPQDRRPGTRLSGVEATLPADLGKLADAGEVHIETHPWYGIPFSVTTVIATDSGRLFVPSIYESVQVFPGSKFWNRVVAADPRVRLRVDGQLYPMEIHPLLDEAEFQKAFDALGRKYPYWREQVRVDRSEARFAMLELRRRESR